MYDSDAIEAIVDLARESTEVSTHSDTHIRIIERNGFTRFQRTPPQPRRYKASSFAGFVSGVRETCMVDHPTVRAEVEDGKPREPDPVFNDPAIFVGPGEVRLVFSEADRRECLVLPLVQTPGYKALAEGKLRGLTQQAMIRAIKQMFDNKVNPSSLIPDIKALKFRASSEGQSVVSTGRESIGNDIKREIAGMTNDLPEEVVLGVRVFTDPSAALNDTDEIRCHFTVDLETQQFSLTAIDGEVEAALDSALDRIAIALANADLDEHLRIVHGVTVEK